MIKTLLFSDDSKIHEDEDRKIKNRPDKEAKTVISDREKSDDVTVWNCKKKKKNEKNEKRKTTDKCSEQSRMIFWQREQQRKQQKQQAANEHVTNLIEFYYDRALLRFSEENHHDKESILRY